MLKWPDVNNEHRMLNPGHPYRRKRRAPKVIVQKAITEAESGLGNEKVVLSGWAQPPLCVKLIEQGGASYLALKKKWAKLSEQMEKGASAHFEIENVSTEENKKEGNKSSSDDQDDEDEKEDDGENHDGTEKKRHIRTKAEVEKEAIKGNLYGALEMYDVTYEADEKMITKAYRKMALKYHPDKLGEKLTDRMKEVWLGI